MKNRVNFYQVEFHPKLRLLSLSLVVACWVFALVLSLSVYFFLTDKQQQLKVELTAKEQTQQQQQILIEELQAGVEQRVADPQLLSEVEKSQKLIRIKKRILNELSGQEAIKSNSFSTLMLDLADHHQPGLWLTRISLDGRSATIQGAADESASIPRWVNLLAKTDYFKGQQFTDTRLFRDSNQQLNFVLANGQTESPKSELSNE